MRLLLVGLALGLYVACSAAPRSDAEQARSIEGQVWSPYCPGRLLVDCSTQQSADLRAEIARRVEDGATSDEVLEWVRTEYGEAAIARPDASPRGLVIWLVPAAIFLAGAVVVVRFVSRNLVRTTSKEVSHADP